jgi:3-deoxy-manno-octulosonate cytidylyltransferase (CMP-KDO synthetase)
VVVCADDRRIQVACQQHGVESILTAVEHPTGTDRLSEAVLQLGLDESALIVNVQGDEPLIEPATVSAVARVLHQRPECEIATVAHPLQRIEDLFDPNVVKVVTDAAGLALLFSRAPIPWSRDHFGAARGGQGIDRWPDDLPALRHVGLYAYRVGFLQRFRQLAPAPIELAEKLEQLRALWHGARIAVMKINAPLPPGVDTPEDLARVRALLAAVR